MRLVALALLVVAAGCKHRDKGDEIVVTSGTCVRCEAPKTTGALASKAMDETSGLVASSRSDGVFFAHNDSGDSARFFAIDPAGKLLATFVFSSADVIDCEDIARGPCAPGEASSCLFIGDIGDNRSRRDHVTIYRVREPEVIADATVVSDAFSFRYPDGAHDAETLLVHPKTGVVTIVSKESKNPSSIYEAPMPLSSSGVATLRRMGGITSPAGSVRFTGGDVHPQGKGILLRTYTHVYFAPMRPDEAIAAALASPLCSLPVAKEDQGESIAWLRSGDGFLTTSEGKGAPVSSVACELP